MEDLTSLLARAQADDTGAYSRIVESFQDMAVGYGYAILGDFHLAQDAAQEAFIEAYLSLPRLNTPEAFPGLLRRIVFKHCDRLTRRGRQYHIVSLEEAVGQASRDPGPVEQLEEKEIRRAIHKALEILSDQEREIVLLFYISDYSQKQISSFLDISISTVKNRLYSARKRMKERLLIMVEQNLPESKPSKDDLFLNKVMNIIAPDQDKDAEAIYDLYEHKLRWPSMAMELRKGRIAGSHYDWTTSRIGLVDNDLMAHIGVYEIKLRLGTALVRLAGVNMDDVYPDYETGQTLFDKTMEDTIHAMYMHGYDLSVVRAAPLSRYEPHGYVYFMPKWATYKIKTEHLPTEPPDLRIQEIDNKDIYLYPGVAEMYNLENENVSMTAVRPTYPHGKCPYEPVNEDGWGPSCLFIDSKGQLAGYSSDPLKWDAEVHRDWFGVTDSAGDPEQRLRLLGDLARKNECKGVEFHNLPYHSAMARCIRRLEYTYTFEKTDRHSPMRIINLVSTLSKMADDFAQRLRTAGHGNWTGALRITAADQSVCLNMKDGCITVTETADTDNVVEGGQEIIRLLMGSDAPGEVVTEAGILVRNDAEWLIHALFPAQNPILPNEYL